MSRIRKAKLKGKVKQCKSTLVGKISQNSDDSNKRKREILKKIDIGLDECHYFPSF